MPTFRIKVKVIETGERHRVMVWGKDIREANLNAVKVVRGLLNVKDVEVV